MKRNDIVQEENTVFINLKYRSVSAKNPRWDHYKAFKRGLEAAIYNSGKFSKICYDISPENCKGGGNIYYLDIDFIGFNKRKLGYYKGKNYWWIAWIAIYPYPLIWPWQPADGFVFIRMNAVLKDKNGSIIRENDFTVKKEYSIFEYGFVYVKPIEKLSYLSHLELLGKVTEFLKSMEKKSEISRITD